MLKTRYSWFSIYPLMWSLPVFGLLLSFLCVVIYLFGHFHFCFSVCFICFIVFFLFFLLSTRYNLLFHFESCVFNLFSIYVCGTIPLCKSLRSSQECTFVPSSSLYYGFINSATTPYELQNIFCFPVLNCQFYFQGMRRVFNNSPHVSHFLCSS